MSEESVEIVRRLVDAFNGGDDDAVLAEVHPEIEFRSDLVEHTTYHGHAGVRDYRRDLDDAWSSWRFDENRFLEAGEVRVLQLYRLILHGRDSGIPVHLEGAILWIVRAGKVVAAPASWIRRKRSKPPGCRRRRVAGED